MVSQLKVNLISRLLLFNLLSALISSLHQSLFITSMIPFEGIQSFDVCLQFIFSSIFNLSHHCSQILIFPFYQTTQNTFALKYPVHPILYITTSQLNFSAPHLRTQDLSAHGPRAPRGEHCQHQPRGPAPGLPQRDAHHRHPASSCQEAGSKRPKPGPLPPQFVSTSPV